MYWFFKSYEVIWIANLVVIVFIQSSSTTSSNIQIIMQTWPNKHAYRYDFLNVSEVSTIIFSSTCTVNLRQEFINYSTFLVTHTPYCIYCRTKHSLTTNVLHKSEFRTQRNCLYSTWISGLKTVYLHSYDPIYAVQYVVWLEMYRINRKLYTCVARPLHSKIMQYNYVVGLRVQLFSMNYFHFVP